MCSWYADPRQVEHPDTVAQAEAFEESTMVDLSELSPVAKTLNEKSNQINAVILKINANVEMSYKAQKKHVCL